MNNLFINPMSISMAAVVMVAGTVIYADRQQVSDLNSTVRRLNSELAGFDELKARLLAEMDRQKNQRIDSQISAAQFSRNQIQLPTGGYNQPLQPFK